jgi:DNA-binding MarR family transcriptional regulator
MLSLTTIRVKPRRAAEPREAMPTQPARNAAEEESEAPLKLGQLERHLGYFLRRLQVWAFQDFIATLKQMDVRPAQYSVLLLIESNPGRSQSAIGRALNVERARLARLLHDLEDRNWIVRRTSGRDARSHALVLTADGEKALAKIKALAEQHEAKLSDFIGSQRRAQLMDLLREFG